MSGRCVPPVYGSLRIQTSSRPGSCAITAATASGIAPRWTGMCSACAIMRPRSSKRAVEQSRRSLMLAENEARISTAPISSAIERSELPRTWSSIFTVWSRSATVASRSRQHQRAISIPIPHPPGGYEARCAVELDCGRTFDVQRLAGRQVEHRRGSGLGRADRDEFELAGPVGVAVALLMRTVKGLREVALDRNRQLERLARVAQVRFALRRKVFYLGKGSHVRYDAVAPLLARDESERREDTGGGRHEHRADLELVGKRAGMQRARTAEGDERELARVVATLDRDDAQGPQHLGIDDLECSGGIDAPESRRGR